MPARTIFEIKGCTQSKTALEHGSSSLWWRRTKVGALTDQAGKNITPLRKESVKDHRSDCGAHEHEGRGGEALPTDRQNRNNQGAEAYTLARLTCRQSVIPGTSMRERDKKGPQAGIEASTARLLSSPCNTAAAVRKLHSFGRQMFSSMTLCQMQSIT
jgi:hypothetical protein